MIGILSGNSDSVNAFTSCLNKTIAAMSLGEDDALHLTMDDGTRICIYDGGQSCCESRYMRTDDNLSNFIGAKLLDAELKPAANLPAEYGEHEIAFLDIKTDKGVFQLVTHNEHNGYYGGFLIRAAAE